MVKEMKSYFMKKLLQSSLMLSIVYTIGHIIIAMLCNYFITGAELSLAAMDALIEPIINGFWFYSIHKLFKYYV